MSGKHTIPEQFVLMGKLAGPVVTELSQRLDGSPNCVAVQAYQGRDYVWFIDAKMDDMQVFVPRLTEAMNRIGRCVDKAGVQPALNRLRYALEDILNSMDEVKCSPLSGMAEGKPLLLNLMGSVVRDTLVRLRQLHEIATEPEKYADRAVIDLSITYQVNAEARAFNAWCKRYRRTHWWSRWKSFLLGFGLGWLVFGRDHD